jgi:microcystin-dependent protein
VPISDGEWQSIRTLVERTVSQIGAGGSAGQRILTSQVVKRDPEKKVVYIPEFGDQPVPLVDFGSEARAYDADAPIGTISQWSDDVPPENYLVCDGRAVSRTEYSELFALIGTTYGAGDGSTTFNLPLPSAGGPAGPPGPQGEPGEKWFTGSGAPSGAVGVVGDWYLDSANGDYYEKTGTSTWTLRGNLKGPAGAQGPQGIQGAQGATGQAEGWYSGSGAPAGALGAVGDWYLDFATGDVYEKTGASAWTARGNIRGPQGPVGPMGTVYDTDQIGTIKAFSGQTIPVNWMLADGRSLLRSDYPDLFAAIGTIYGAADGTHFNIPDLRSRFIYGATTPAGNGGVGGEAAHVLSAAEMPSHSHVVNSHAHTGATGNESQNHWAMPDELMYNNTYFQYAGAAGYTATDRATARSHTHSIPAESPGTNAQGGGGSHNNLPPYILIAQIIKVTGVQIDSGGALVGPTGPQGDTGATGPQGVQGPQGPVGPSAELAYAENVATTNVIQAGSVVLTFPARTFDGATPIHIDLWMRALNAVGSVMRFGLADNGANIFGGAVAGAAYFIGGTGGGYEEGYVRSKRFIPTAGSHTYEWRALMDGAVTGAIYSSTDWPIHGRIVRA